MHGGIGMTDEYDVGLFMKRDRASQSFWAMPIITQAGWLH